MKLKHRKIRASVFATILCASTAAFACLATPAMSGPSYLESGKGVKTIATGRPAGVMSVPGRHGRLAKQAEPKTSPSGIGQRTRGSVPVYTEGAGCDPQWQPWTASEAPDWITTFVEEVAPTYDLDPRLVMSVMAIESRFHTKARSHKNAQGLMQLIPGTAERFGVRDPYDPRQNIRGGMKYLKWLMSYFEGDISLTLAGYNAGEKAVDRHGGIPPYQETQAYVENVKAVYRCNSVARNPWLLIVENAKIR
ncbi:MAG: lytic transglycosylase domain-containing protein [Rhodospirillales bacterium]|nr:lytic transglycosylase domain-containing protein [Rhodospirillales bacterium]